MPIWKGGEVEAFQIAMNFKLIGSNELPLSFFSVYALPIPFFIMTKKPYE